MSTVRVGSVLVIVGWVASACGSSGDASPSSTVATGGVGSTNSQAATGGELAANGDVATGGVYPGSGGAATGDGAATGGTEAGGAATGGAETGGTATGGVATGGAETGGTATGGVATGGAETGGTATGGVETGGTATGGVATGGVETGGATTGGTETGGTATGGAAAGGSSDCFPPITDFAANDGGFGRADREIVEIGTGDSVSLFRPSDENFGQDGCRHPLVVWGNGSTNTVDIWAGHLARAASYGFVIVAPEQTQVSSDHMNDALDFVLQLSQDSSSNYFGKVDTTKLGSTGYSLGGMGAMRVAADPRIGATFIWDSSGNSAALYGPLGGIFAENGISSGWVDMIDSCQYPAFGMEAAGTDHTSVLGYPGGFGGFGGTAPYAQEAYVAWLRWHFMGDPAARALFAGDSCGFCGRDGITVHTSGID